MKVRELLVRVPVTVDVSTTIGAAARTMGREGVGALVVTDGGHPVGVVTDRDLVVRGVARDMPGDARIDALMTMGVIAIDADADTRELVDTFGHHAVRRVPVVDHDRVVGIVTLDDMLMSLTGDVADLTRGLTAQVLFPHAGDEAPAPAVSA
jgi:signal-transduction protein with cAMP-binding, CBS, and nucleotidyltransferase domain